MRHGHTSVQIVVDLVTKGEKDVAYFVCLNILQVCSSRLQGVLDRVPAFGEEKTYQPCARVKILHEASPGSRGWAYGCQRFCHEM